MKPHLAVALLLIGGCRSADVGDAGATGTLEYVEVDVAPLAAARVVRVNRREGDVVKSGDTLLVLSQPTVQSTIEAQQARVTSAEARARELEAGSRSTEINRANDELRAAESEADRLARDADRLAPLAAKGDISRQQLDIAQTAARTAAAKRDAAEQAVSTLKAGARPEEISAARAEVAAAKAAMRGAAATQADLVLIAHSAGVVTTRSVEPGDIASPAAPAMTIADMSRPFVRVYVNQSQLPSLRVGDRVQGFLDAYPRRAFAGRIEAIGTKAEFTPRVALTRDERADLMFGVRVAFVDSTNTLKAGLPITVRFDAPPGK